MKYLLVASTGGHLSQLGELRDHWDDDVDVHWVTFRKPDAESRCAGDAVTWAHFPTTRNIPNALRNLRLAFWLMRRDRPDVVVSTGAGVAVPFFVAARVFRVPTVYLEVYDRITSQTLTGRLCYAISDRFLVQWPQQQEAYPDARLVGTVY